MYSSKKILLVENKNMIVGKVAPCNVMKHRSRLAINGIQKNDRTVRGCWIKQYILPGQFQQTGGHGKMK